MAIARDQDEEDETKKSKARRELGLSCMLNTEVTAVLAVIRRCSNPNSQFLPSSEESYIDPALLNSLKSLRAIIFSPQQEWCKINPSIYVSPFLDVIQSDDVPATATSVSLSAVLKILNLEIFDEKTPGAGDVLHAIITALTNCRLEKTDPISEDATMMKILQVLMAIIKSRAASMLTDQAVCTIMNSCFQIVQQSASRGDLLQRSARYTMHELIQVIFAQLPNLDSRDGIGLESDIENGENLGGGGEGYGVRCMVDIFHFLCLMLNAVEVVDTDGLSPTNTDEEVQIFALVLINSAIELGGEVVGKHQQLLRMIQDDLFQHLIHYGTCSSPLFLSVICSTVLNLYHFLRRSLRLQLEAFFTYVLFKVPTSGSSFQLQEVALEGIIGFCRQPTFVIEAYVNYDCDPICRNIFEDIGKLLCRYAFPTNSPLTSMQIQAFEGLIAIIHNIADNINDSQQPGPVKPVDVSEYRPFWLEKCSNPDDLETWVEFVRLRKFQKKKIMIAANHYNRDDKKGLEFLKICNLVPDPPDAISYAYFLRYTPGLEKNKIGDFLGDPDELHLQVLKEFTDTFNFTGVILDTALRTYLETFRLPGESQKIQRILEAFSEKFYEQQSSEIFVSKDAVFILCYSLIMLNTDQHNPQVKKKMTEEEFIRNNRAINGGKDLPREYLSELFMSISNNAIALFEQSPTSMEMNPNRWDDLVKRSKILEPYIMCSFDNQLSRELFAAISGPTVAALSAIFEHTDEDEMLHECIEAMLSIARIARYGLEDVLDQILASFCKFTTLLNPYASTEETLFTFSNDLKPRMATLAVFTIGNKFGDSVRGGWRNMVDCLLRLKRLKLLPQTTVELDAAPASGTDIARHAKTESLGMIFPSSLQSGLYGSHRNSGMVGRYSQFLSLDGGMEESMVSTAGNEFEQNLKIIHQCRIWNIFNESSSLPDESLLNLGRTLIFAAAGKGQKFSTPIEEEETVGFCWELLATVTLVNVHRFQTFWPVFHDYLILVSQFPLFSPCPFAEKAIVALFKIYLQLIASPEYEKNTEELIFKSINLTWKLDKEILDTCCENITESVCQILTENIANIQTVLGWKTILHLLSVTGRHPETFDQGVETMVMLFSEETHISKSNYGFCIDCAFGFAALKISPLEKSMKLIDLIADSVKLIVQWHQTGHSDPGSNSSNLNNASTSLLDDGSKTGNPGNVSINLFIKLTETLRKTSLVRREEIRNHAVSALQRAFSMADDLGFTPSNCINCFNLVIFAMVDDLHEKTVEYSQRGNAERESRSMEGTLKMAMELLVDVFLQFLMLLAQHPGFRTFWMGLLRRMDTCMKAELGYGSQTSLQEAVPQLLKKMITEMKEKEILMQKDGDELWEVTYIQIQWIAPSVKEELFPEDF